MKRKGKLLGAGLLAALMLLGGCSLLPEEDELQKSPVIVQNDLITYKTTVVLAGDIADVEEIYCTYKPVHSESYSFDLEGEFFDTAFVTEGQHVEEGDLLIQLNISSIETAIASNQHEIDTANLNVLHLQQERDLKAKQADELLKVLPPEAAGTAQSSAEVYASYQNRINSIYNNITVLELRKAELFERRAQRQLRAGFSGSVTMIATVTNRDVCEQGKAVVTVADTATSMFTAKTEYYDRLKSGDTYEMTIGDEVFSVTVADPEEIREIGEEPQEGYVYLKLEDAVADFDQNASGRVNLVLAQSNDTLYALSSAIITTPNGSMVYSLDENGVMTMIPVEVGISNGKYTEIKSGVTASQELILE